MSRQGGRTSNLITQNMATLYKLSVTKNMVTVEGTEWNGRDSDELHGFNTVTRRIQEGWKVKIEKADYDWTEVENGFRSTIKEINSLLKFGIEINIPRDVKVSVDVDNFKLLEEKVINDDEFEFIEEETYLQVREGMSTHVYASDRPVLSAHTKHNNRGHSVCGYACILVTDDKKMEDVEFYQDVLKEFNI